MTTSALMQARDIVRQLTAQEKLYLLNDITTQLVQESLHSDITSRPAFPILHVDVWPADMPQSRADLYNDRGR